MQKWVLCSGQFAFPYCSGGPSRFLRIPIYTDQAREWFRLQFLSPNLFKSQTLEEGFPSWGLKLFLCVTYLLKRTQELRRTFSCWVVDGQSYKEQLFFIFQFWRVFKQKDQHKSIFEETLFYLQVTMITNGTHHDRKIVCPIPFIWWLQCYKNDLFSRCLAHSV